MLHREKLCYQIPLAEVKVRYFTLVKVVIPHGKSTPQLVNLQNLKTCV